MSALKVLITGGAGYIGSTVASACVDAGITPVVLDNLSSGRVEFVRGRPFYQGDIADARLLQRIFADHPDIGAAVHCAALVTVEGSARDPLSFYRENVTKTVALLENLMANGCTRLIFSSSAAIYRSNGLSAIEESADLCAANPYGRTKAVAELMLEDVSSSSDLRVISLRYFNPIGADPLLRSGSYEGRGRHALGQIIHAHRNRVAFQITGATFATRDGTGVRDYVHVWDLALGHVAALRRFDLVVPPAGHRHFEAINLGSGTGSTVRELIAAFETVVGQPLVVQEVGPRPGDVAESYASTAKAGRLLGWRPTLDIADGIRTALAWADHEPAELAPLGPAPVPVTC